MIQSLGVDDPMVGEWSNHLGLTIQWLGGDPIIWGWWSNGWGVIQSYWVDDPMVGCGEIQSLGVDDPMVGGWSNLWGVIQSLGVMIRWFLGDPIIGGRWNEVMLVKFTLMLVKCQINTNTNQNGFSFPTKCVERILNYPFFVSIILNYQFPKTMFADL